MGVGPGWARGAITLGRIVSEILWISGSAPGVRPQLGFEERGWTGVVVDGVQFSEAVKEHCSITYLKFLCFSGNTVLGKCLDIILCRGQPVRIPILGIREQWRGLWVLGFFRAVADEPPNKALTLPRLRLE